MKREIKFRAWDNVNKNMELNIHHLDLLNEFLSKEKYDVMQFTGLLDKNGNKIYEGDIFNYGGIIGQVVFNSGCFNFFNGKNITMCMRDHESNQFEIIGNIHQNPDLLC